MFGDDPAELRQQRRVRRVENPMRRVRLRGSRPDALHEGHDLRPVCLVALGQLQELAAERVVPPAIEPSLLSEQRRPLRTRAQGGERRIPLERRVRNDETIAHRGLQRGQRSRMIPSPSLAARNQIERARISAGDRVHSTPELRSLAMATGTVGGVGLPDEGDQHRLRLDRARSGHNECEEECEQRAAGHDRYGSRVMD
jgi:hypothetical protein